MSGELAQNDGPSVAEPRHRECVGPGDMVVHYFGVASRRDPRGLVQILQSDRDTVQWPPVMAGGYLGLGGASSLRLRAIFGMMQRLDLTDNERAVLITALRRLVDFDPWSLSPQTNALKAILERLEPHTPQPVPDTAGTG